MDCEADGVPSALRDANLWKEKPFEPNIIVFEDDDAPPLVKAFE